MSQVVSSKTLVLPGHGTTTTLVQNLNLTNAYFEAKSDFHACFFEKWCFSLNILRKNLKFGKNHKKHHLLHEEIISLYFWDRYIVICFGFLYFFRENYVMKFWGLKNCHFDWFSDICRNEDFSQTSGPKLQFLSL